MEWFGKLPTGLVYEELEARIILNISLLDQSNLSQSRFQRSQVLNLAYCNLDLLTKIFSNPTSLSAITKINLARRTELIAALI